MLILALESSGDLASCALWRDGQVIERHCPAGETSSATLLPAVSVLLADSGAELSRVEAVAFGAGPGSFTGLRVACGLAQGLAFALGVPVIPVGTLDAIAWSSRNGGRVLAVLDARMNEVYFQTFDCAGAAPVALTEPGLAAPAAVPAPGAGWSVCGNAIAAYPELRERQSTADRLNPESAPTAAAIATLGARLLVSGRGVAADEAVPLYVRDRVALTVAERLAAGGKA